VAKHGWAGLSDGQLEKRLARTLGVTFVDGPPPVAGGSPGRVAALGDDAWVAIQVERKHTHPAENVLQWWPWLERTKRRLILVHAIAPDARRRTGARADLTTWLGAMMERVLPARFAYCRVELGTDAEPVQVADALGAIAAARRPPAGRSQLHLPPDQR
jgi:hypothetical protein